MGTTTNRVSDAIYFYAEQEALSKISNPLQAKNDPYLLSLKENFYTNLYKKYRKTANRQERESLRYVKEQIAKTRAKLKPSLLKRILYSSAGTKIRSFLMGYNMIYLMHDKNIENLYNDQLKGHNLQQLSASMKKAGFDFNMEGPLQKMISQDLPSFHLHYADVHSKDTSYTLHFKKAPGTDLYYFDHFDAAHKPSINALLNNNASSIRHSFSLHDEYRFTAQEAANLINDKPVFKTINGDEAWHYLKAYPTGENNLRLETYNFNLEKKLSELPIKNWEIPAQRNTILDAIKSGGTREVTLLLNDLPVKYILRASPRNNSIELQDKNGLMVDINRLLKGTHLSIAKKIKSMQDENGVIDMGKHIRKSKRVTT